MNIDATEEGFVDVIDTDKSIICIHWKIGSKTSRSISFEKKLFWLMGNMPNILWNGEYKEWWEYNINFTYWVTKYYDKVPDFSWLYTRLRTPVCAIKVHWNKYAFIGLLGKLSQNKQQWKNYHGESISSWKKN